MLVLGGALSLCQCHLGDLGNPVFSAVFSIG